MKLLLIALFAFTFKMQSHAFVENVSHGYMNCMACHISPSGGGVLNDYGRSLSRELMSAWGWKNSEKPLLGLIDNQSQLKVGGDFRAIQTYFENDQLRQGKQFIMQKNVELAYQYRKVWFVAALGSQEGPKEVPKKGNFLSERHYLLWDVSEVTKLRIGKFRLNYGLNDPNHTRYTKQLLNFGSNSESYIVEFSHFSEEDEVFISSDLGRIDIPRNKSTEKSFSASYSKYLFEKSKIGTSVLFGENHLKRRSLVGVNAVVGNLANNIIKFEIDYERSAPSATPSLKQNLYVGNLTWGIQVHKGILPYAVSEFSKQDSPVRSSRAMSHGLGVQLLPLPHFEIQAEYKIAENTATISRKNKNGWFLFHFYL